MNVNDIKHPDVEIQRQLRDLYTYTRESKDTKAIKKIKTKQMRTALKNSGLLSLPFTINSKKF